MVEYIQNLKSGESIRYTHAVHPNPPCDLFAMHSHNVYEIIHIISGDASYIIEDRKYKLSAGDMVITRPSDYHYIEINSSIDYNRQAIIFDGKALGLDMSILPKGLDVLPLAEHGEVREIFAKLDKYAELFFEERFFEILESLTREMVYNLSVLKQAPRMKTDFGASPILTAALAYIREHLFDISDIAEIAEAVFVTESYLFRLFKNHLGQSPKKYIRDKRMLKAQRMLLDGRRPSDVAAACGFSDYATFYRNYTSFFGISPSNKNFDYRLTKDRD